MKRAFSVMGLGRFMSWGRDVPCHGARTFHVMGQDVPGHASRDVPCHGARTFHVIGQDVPCHASRDVPWNVPTSMTNRISGQNDEKVCDLRYN